MTHLDDETLSAHLDAALPPRRAAEVERHLAACPACGARLRMLSATARAVAALPEVDLPRPLDLDFLRASGVHPTNQDSWGPRGWPAADDAAGLTDAPRVIALPRPPPGWAWAATAAAAALLLGLPFLPYLPRGGAPVAETRLDGGGATLTHGQAPNGSAQVDWAAALGLTVAHGAAIDGYSRYVPPGTGSQERLLDGQNFPASPSSPVAVPELVPAAGSPVFGGNSTGLPSRTVLAPEHLYGPDGVDLTVSVSPSTARVGTPVDVYGTLGVTRQVHPTRIALYAVSTDGQRTLIGDAAFPKDGIGPSDRATLHLRWSAGSAADGTGAGGYTLELDVDLPAQGSTPAHSDTVSLPYSVT